MTITRLLVCAAIVSAVLVLPGDTVHAVEGLEVTIQPSMIDERIDPGTMSEGVLHITNENGGRQTYYIGLRNIESMDESGRPVFADAATDDALEAASWIRLGRTDVTLDVGSTADVPYTIAVPDDASPGSHFAAIIVTRQADVAVESGASVGFQVASLMHVRVNGDVIESLDLREFSASRMFYSSAEVTFNTRIANTGRVHERPRGVVVISDMLGRRVGEFVVNESGGGIVPSAERLFTNTWSSDEFALGRYTAKATFVYGEGTRSNILREVSFWIVPLREVGIVFGIIVCVLGGVMLGIRAYVRAALRRAGHTDTGSGRVDERTLARRMRRTLLWFAALCIMVALGLIVFFA